MTSKIEYFKDQAPHQIEGVGHWYVLTDHVGSLSLHHVPTTEVDKFLETTEFVRMVGVIPRFGKPGKKDDSTEDQVPV